MKSMLNLKEINYIKCICCDCGYSIENGQNFEFITEKGAKLNKFICDDCIDTILNNPKIDEWY